MSLILLILGLFMFVGLVVLHEYGHFIAARRNGVEVEEFGIGFPPRAKVVGQRNGTVYTLNWLPLGGFVKLKGEHDSATSSGSFGAARLKTKVKILLAGVGMNLLAAFVLFTIGTLIGIPKVLPDQFTIDSDTTVATREVYVGYIEPSSPAANVGLVSQDRLISLTANNQTETIDSPEELSQLTEANAGQTVQLNVERGGEEKIAFVELRGQPEVEASRQTEEPKGYLGIVPGEYILQRSTWSAPIVALGLIRQLTVETFKGLGSAIAGLLQGDTQRASEQVSGPVGVFVLLRNGSIFGLQFIIFVIGVVSLALAIMNTLPIPALDGGRLFVTLLFRVLRKPLTKNLEESIHGLGFMALMVLFVLITIVDIKRFF